MNNIRTNLRIGGLATGFDTDTMVRDLMRAERMKVDKLYQNRTLLQWKQEDYRSMNNLLTTLRNRSFDMRLQGTYRKFSTTSTNEAAVTATASGAASSTSYEFTSITQLASSASAVSFAGDGQPLISVSRHVLQGQSIQMPLVTYRIGEDAFPEGSNSFTVRMNIGGENRSVQVTLPEDRIYNNQEPGSMLSDIVAEINSQLGDLTHHVQFHLTQRNTISVVAESEVTLSVASGNSTLARLGFATSSSITSTQQRIDTSLSIKDLIDQGRLAGALNIIWVPNVDKTISLDLSPEKTMVIEERGLYDALKLQDPGQVRITIGAEQFTVLTKLEDGESVPEGAVLVTGDASRLILQFHEDYDPGESDSIEIYRKDGTIFEITLANHNQNGVKVSETFRVNALTDSINTIISRINNSPTLGLQAFYDSFSDKFSITSKWKGNNNIDGQDIVLDGPGSNFFADVLKVRSFTDGQNAQFTLNGLATERKDNTFTINGVTFTLKQTLGAGERASVSVSQDKEAVFKTIEEFVKLYNDTIEQVNKKLTEERHAGYPPLTDEQKQAMKDDDIKKWEEKSRSGMLKGDDLLAGAIDSLRRAFGDPVSGITNPKFSQMSAIGINTSSYFERGKLTIDANKLRAAIDEDFDGVIQLFTQSKSDTAGLGIAGRLREALDGVVKDISTRAGSASSLSRVDTSSIGEQVKRINQRIDAENRRLTRVEDRYWKQFAALEKTIGKMNSQSAWLAQQFAPRGQ